MSEDEPKREELMKALSELLQSSRCKIIIPAHKDRMIYLYGLEALEELLND